MRVLIVALAVSFALGCASKKEMTTTDARQELEDRYRDKIGVFQKNDFAQTFGDAEWCRPTTGGEETCRFYSKKGVVWKGDPSDRKHYEAFDEIVADFGVDKKLKSYKANAQR